MKLAYAASLLAPLLGAAWFFAKSTSRGFLAAHVRAWGFLALCAALPALAQTASLAGSLPEGGLVLSVSWWVGLGGWTSQRVLGVSAASQDPGLLSVLLVAVVQTLLLSIPIARRFQAGASAGTPLVRTIGVIVFVNAWAGAMWMWWGT